MQKTLQRTFHNLLVTSENFNLNTFSHLEFYKSTNSNNNFNHQLQKYIMPVKLYLDNKIHSFAKLPSNLTAFVESITTVFGSWLPLSWNVQYVCDDGNEMTITQETDYSRLLEVESQKSSSSIDLYLIRVNQQDGNVLSTPNKEIKEEIHNQMMNSQQNELIAFEVEGNEETQQKEVDQNFNQLSSQNQVEKTAQTDYNVILNDRQQFNEVYPQGYSQPQNESDLSILTKAKRERSSISDSSRKVFQMNDLLHDLIEIQDFKGDESMENASLVHINTVCKGCGMQPIVGIRYKCSVCHKFDFCGTCEDTKAHPHNFLKVRRLEEGKENFKKDKKMMKKRQEPLNEEEIAMFKAMKKIHKLIHHFQKRDNIKMIKCCEKLIILLPEIKPKLDSLLAAIEQPENQEDIMRNFKDLKLYVSEKYDPEGKFKFKKSPKHEKRMRKDGHHQKNQMLKEEITEQQISLLKNALALKEMFRAYRRQDEQRLNEYRAKIEQEVPELKTMLDNAFYVMADGQKRKKVEKAFQKIKAEFKARFFPGGKPFKLLEHMNIAEGECKRHSHDHRDRKHHKKRDNSNEPQNRKKTHQ